jgi:hypothetical protein
MRLSVILLIISVLLSNLPLFYISQILPYNLFNHKQQYLQLDSGVKVSVRVLMGSCSSRVKSKTIKLVFVASFKCNFILVRQNSEMLILKKCSLIYETQVWMHITGTHY